MQQPGYSVSRYSLLAALGASVLLHGVALVWLAPLPGAMPDVAATAGPLRLRIVASPGVDDDDVAAQADAKPGERSADNRRPAQPERSPAVQETPQTESAALQARGAETPPTSAVVQRSSPEPQSAATVNPPPPQPAEPVAAPRQEASRPSAPVRTRTPRSAPQPAASSRPPAKPDLPPPFPEPRATGQQQALLHTPPLFAADYLHNPPPAYPPLARRLRLEGRVVLRVRVGRRGEALEVEVEKGSGHTLLDRTAQAAVREWRFEPARRGSEPVEDWVRVPVAFRLSGR